MKQPDRHHRTVSLSGGLMFFLCFLQSCYYQDDDQEPVEVEMDKNGVIVEQPHLWVTDLSLDNMHVHCFMDPVVYENTVVTPGIIADHDWYLVGLDTETGEEQWRWTDYFVSDYWYNDYSPQSGPLFFKTKAGFSSDMGVAFYAIDTRTGETVWKDFHGRTFETSVVVEGDYLYTSFYPVYEDDFAKIPVIYRRNIYTSELDSLTVPAIDSIRLSPNFQYGRTNGLHPFRGKDGDEYLLIPFGEYQPMATPADDSHGDIFLGLYNITRREYVYDKMPLTEKAQSFMEPTLLYENEVVIVNTNRIVFGVDVYTGEIMWYTEYDHGVFSMIIEDDVLVMAQVIGADTYAYGKDPMTGREIWKIPSAGGASTLKALNGVVYWKDRADGKLYAVEAATGKLLWKLNDPDPESDSWWKSDGVGIQPGEDGKKGKIFASSHRRMYCYEAAR